VTTIAPQALTLVNSKLSREWSESLAARVIHDAGPQLTAEMDRAYLLLYSRHPDSQERDMSFTFLDRQLKILSERAGAGERLSQVPDIPAGMNPLQAAALVDFCQALVNSNEFVYSN